MGQGQSQDAADSNPNIIRINRDEIPEQYRTVGVSSEVVKRVNAQSGGAPASVGGGEEAAKLKAELDRERAEKARMREEMSKLTQLQARGAAVNALPNLTSDIEERKRIFDETVQRVEKQFFAYQRENVCSDNEQKILECLNSNPGKVLKCQPLADIYEKCVADFRQQVLTGQ